MVQVLTFVERNCFDRIIGGKEKSSYQTTCLFRDCGLTRVVNNVETIASVPWIVNNSGDDYAKIGIGRSTGTRVNFSFW
jgi:NADH:ubiquinone oxidoreductase subunit F (NADH-binding)